LDEEEKRKWRETEPERRRQNFIPQNYDALRKVPFYGRFYEERLERCMDLYLAPRQRKMRVKIVHLKMKCLADGREKMN
jgi:ribosome biogenesis protein ERB1